jgi:selenoprotein W-related protein
VSALTQLLSQKALEGRIARFTLVPSHGGVFEFKVDGELLFSKKALGRHAEPNELLTLLTTYLDEHP